MGKRAEALEIGIALPELVFETLAQAAIETGVSPALLN